MATRRRLKSQLIELWPYALGKHSRQREGAASSSYLAFSIGPEMLAVGVYELDVQNDEDALQKATPLFHEGLKRIEVWCGSRKVGDILPKVDDMPHSDTVRDST